MIFKDFFDKRFYDRYFSRLDQHIEGMGLTLHMITDPEEIWSLAWSLPHWEDARNPAFDTARNNLTPDLVGAVVIKKDETIVGMVASRKTVLETCLSDKGLSLFYDTADVPGESIVISGRLPKIVAGRVSFAGLLWLHPEVRGKGLVPLLMHLNRVVAAVRWNTDYDIGLVGDKLTRKGFATGMYLFQTLEACVRWINPAFDDGFYDLWLLASHRSHIMHQAEAAAQDVFSLLLWAPRA